MNGFSFRGLEFHSSRMWQWAQVERALDFMQESGLNALIFHQNDIIDHLVFPMPFFPYEVMRARWSVRMHSIYQNRKYMQKVVREAKRKDIGFYLEVKELWFHDNLLDVVPELRNVDGSICPANPFWPKFLDIKMRELLDVLPDLAGLIVSPGTRESRVSIAANTCTCERCKGLDPLEWYRGLLGAMRAPLVEKGKTLAVRDFSFTADHQSLMIEAAKACADDIIISLKNTPHDYYPTFPTNPCIGHTMGLRQWVEFDTWGQFWGLGFFPVGVVEDMQRRMRECQERGVDGIFLRTDWEVMTEAATFNSLNFLNVVAGAILARNIDADLDDIYRQWTNRGLYSPMLETSKMQAPVRPTASDAADRLKNFMRASWEVMEQAHYVRGHLFSEDGQWIETVKKSFSYMTEIHSRDHWEPGASARVQPTDENIEIIFAEKRQASEAVKRLPQILQPETLGLPHRMVEDLKTILRFYEIYVRGYELCCHAVYLTRKAELGQSGHDLEAARATLPPLRNFARELVALHEGTSYPHHVYWLLDESRIDDLVADVETILAGLGVRQAMPT